MLSSLRRTPACNPCSGSSRRRSAPYRTRKSPDHRHSDRYIFCPLSFPPILSDVLCICPKRHIMQLKSFFFSPVHMALTDHSVIPPPAHSIVGYFAFLFRVSIRSLAAGPDEAGFWPVISCPSFTV